MKPWLNPHAVSFSQAVADFKSRRDTPRDLLERCIEIIERDEPRVKAFVTLDLGNARRAADEATQRYKAGRALSMVDGCPVGIKDIMATRDMPTQMGSPAFEGWRPHQDAACVHALRAGGAVIVGKTVSTEFAVGFSGPTTNPFDAGRSPGGSSSGSAAAVGGGMLPVALATQTQGSTLRPASYCGAFGFKPSIGALPTAGVHPLSTTCDHLGVIAATLEDVWRIASHISLRVGSPGYGFLNGAAESPSAAIQPAKVIRLYTYGWSEVDPASATAFEAFVKTLAASGVEVIDRHHDKRVAELEDMLADGVSGALDIVAYEMKWPYEEYVERFGSAIGERIRGLVERAREMTPDTYTALLRKRREVKARFGALRRELGASCYVTLSASGPAVKGLAESGSRAFLVYASWLGVPAFSLPLLESGGLPLGVQLIGGADEDGELCGIANWVTRSM
jgi:Asp-tRNA(Asn)/Glu-tRNA(Gln) amidotransferase A subunit family amidase